MQTSAPSSSNVRIEHLPIQDSSNELDSLIARVEGIYSRFSVVLERLEKFYTAYDTHLKSLETAQPTSETQKTFVGKGLERVTEESEIIDAWSPVYKEYHQLVREVSIESYDPTSEKTKKLTYLMTNLSATDAAFCNLRQQIFALDAKERKIRPKPDGREFRHTLQELNKALEQRDKDLRKQRVLASCSMI